MSEGSVGADFLEERMIKDIRVLIVNNIKLSVDASSKEAFSIARKKLASVGIKDDGAE